ncbi:MAG: biotin carboxylase N-terminal domain-containing protein [Myxococcota bacterium]
MFERILLARRSAAALTLSRTGRRLGAQVFGVFGDEDENVHLAGCDGRVSLGDGALLERITAAASEHGIDGVHPGFCDQLPSLELARGLEAAGVAFIGMDPDVLATVSDRKAFRECIERASAKPVESTGPVNDAGDAKGEAYRLGYPIQLRRGEHTAFAMDEDEVDEAWSRLGGEGDAVVERWYERSRTLEVLVAADSEGVVMPIAERETTLGESDHVLLEESPSPALSFRVDGEAIREMIFDLAIRVAKEIGAIGLVRIELLLGPTGEIRITGAYLGLPSLHSVLDKVTKLDLLGLQLRLASGEAMPDEVRFMQTSGHAIGARVLAKDAGAAPTGQRFPAAPLRSVVLEASTAPGHAIPPEDGPVFARITSFAPIRHQASLTLNRILAGAVIDGGDPNIALIRSILDDQAFRAGTYDADTVARLAGR